MKSYIAGNHFLLFQRYYVVWNRSQYSTVYLGGGVYDIIGICHKLSYGVHRPLYRGQAAEEQ